MEPGKLDIKKTIKNAAEQLSAPASSVAADVKEMSAHTVEQLGAVKNAVAALPTAVADVKTTGTVGPLSATGNASVSPSGASSDVKATYIQALH